MKDLVKKPVFVIIIVVIVLIIAAVVYFLFFRKPKQLPPEKLVDAKGVKISWSDDGFPLKKLSSGPKVKSLQAALNILHNTALTIDGKFGDKTLSALKKYYGITSVSEADYNKYVLPNINKINAYMSNHKEEPTKAIPVKQNTTIDFIGKSISANDACTGFEAEPDSDIEYTMNEKKPIHYSVGQYIGIVEKDDNGWLRCSKVNGNRVFILKKYAKT